MELRRNQPGGDHNVVVSQALGRPELSERLPGLGRILLARDGLLGLVAFQAIKSSAESRNRFGIPRHRGLGSACRVPSTGGERRQAKGVGRVGAESPGGGQQRRCPGCGIQQQGIMLLPSNGREPPLEALQRRRHSRTWQMIDAACQHDLSPTMHALTLPAAEMAAAKSEFERFFFERYIAGFVAFARGSDASALDLSQFYNIPICLSRPENPWFFKAAAEANRMFKVMHERFLRPSDFADLVVLDKRLDVLNTNYATVQVFWQFVDSKGKEFFREAVVYTIQRLPQGLRVTAICPAFPTREARTVEEAWKSAGALFDEKAKL